MNGADPAAARKADLLRGFDFAHAMAENDAAHRAELERLLLALTEVLDSFDRLLAGAPEAAPGGTASLGSVRLIGRQLESALRDAGLVPTGVVGELADPDAHHVVEVRSDGDTVVEVLRRGYVFQGRVLRAAQVIVGSSSDRVSG